MTTTFDTIPKPNYGTEIIPRTRVDPPLGLERGLVDQSLAKDFFESYKELGNNLTPWENQNNYPKTLKKETRYFMRDFWQRHLLFLRSQVNKYMPLRVKDTLETDTVILEIQPNIARRTELRAPKTDLNGVSWEQFRTTMKLYGAQATIHQNYGDDGEYGSGMVKYQLKALSDGMESASLLAAYLYLVEKMPNPYYKAVNHRREFDFDDMWERETYFWNATGKKRGLQHIATRKSKELTIQGGVAPVLLISENAQNYVRNLDENIFKFQIGNEEDAAFNKIFGLRPIEKIGNETSVDVLPSALMPEGFEWNPLETHTVRGGVCEIGAIRDTVDYENFKLIYDTKEVTDTSLKTLGSFSLQKCLDHSYLYGADGKLKGDLKDYGSNDMFVKTAKTSIAAAVLKDRYYNPLVDSDGVFHTEYVKQIVTTLHRAMYRSLGMDRKKEAESWSFFDSFMTGNVSGTPAAQFFIDNTDTIPALGYKFAKIDEIAGTMTCFRNLSNYANSTPVDASELSKMQRMQLASFCAMISNMTGFISGVFGPTTEILTGVTTGTYSGILRPEDYFLYHVMRLRGKTMLWPLTFDKRKWYTITTGNGALAGNVVDTLVNLSGNIGTVAVVVASGTQPTGTQILAKTFWADADWKLYETDISLVCSEFNSVLSSLGVAYLTAENTEPTSKKLYQMNTILPWKWLACQPKKEYIGESGLAIAPGGKTLSRSVAFPESRIGESMEGQYYKMTYQIYIGVEPGLPENFGTYDNIHITGYLGGDTTTPTKWDTTWTTKNNNKSHPDLFFVACPHYWKRPKNFVDISHEKLGTIGTSRCIPNWERYNSMWTLKPTKGDKEVRENYITKRLPNDILGETRRRQKHKNYLLAFEPYFEINPLNGERVAVYETGFWKSISPDFYNERYDGKVIIRSRGQGHMMGV